MGHDFGMWCSMIAISVLIFIIGMLVGILMMDNNTAVLQEEVANHICQEIFGDNLMYQDMRIGVESSFNCIPIEPEPAPAPEQRDCVVCLEGGG